jgi:hypothetical protein
MSRWLPLVCALLLAAPAAAQQAKRFELDFGAVDLYRTGWHDYKLANLPDEDLVFGLKITAPDGSRLQHLPKARVRITLVNEREETVFDAGDELVNWTRAESTQAWFLYLRGLDGLQRGPDGGWGTYAHPHKGGSYTLTVETVASDVTMSKFVVRLMGVGGGWK